MNCIEDMSILLLKSFRLHPFDSLKEEPGGVHDCLVLKALLDSEELPEVKDPHGRAFFHAFLSEAKEPKLFISLVACFIKLAVYIEISSEIMPGTASEAQDVAQLLGEIQSRGRKEEQREKGKRSLKEV